MPTGMFSLSAFWKPRTLTCAGRKAKSGATEFAEGHVYRG